MAEDNRRVADDEEEFEIPEDESERGIADGEGDDEFEDDDDADDGEDDEGIGEDRSFTSEIGSEGGSPGDLETTRQKPRVMRGSEASTTAVPDERSGFDDRHEGGGPEGNRR